MTGLENEHDPGSLWSLKEGEGEDMCATGEKIRCGSTVRLEHMSTARNLHSHKFDSPVSGRQEISAFGENGEGDTGDNWELECESGDEYLRGGRPFFLKHADTGIYLYADSRSMFDHNNCRRCPILGQSEISGAEGRTRNALWAVHSGYFFPPD